MSDVKERFNALLDEMEATQLQQWQIAVTQMYAFTVKTGCKNAVEHLIQIVMQFLSTAQDSEEICIPDVM
jgi:hypothetical protein